MEWFVSGREVYIGNKLPEKAERIDPPPPFGQEKLQLSKLLSEGVLHGAIVPGDFGYLGLFGGGTTAPMMAQYPGVKPLIDDIKEITTYTKKSGINPIIHVIVLTQAIVGRHPDLPAKLTRAFGEARDAATPYMDADEIAGNAKERELLGVDPYAYVLGESEKRTWTALNRYQIEQGLLKTMLPLEELFVGQV